MLLKTDWEQAPAKVAKEIKMCKRIPGGSGCRVFACVAVAVSRADGFAVV